MSKPQTFKPIYCPDCKRRTKHERSTVGNLVVYACACGRRIRINLPKKEKSNGSM